MLPLFFSRKPPVVFDRVPVGPTGAPASIRAWFGRTSRFTVPSASGHAGSRTGLPHCTSLRHGKVDEARDWPRLPESKGFPWDHRAPEPFDCCGALPQAFAQTRHRAWIGQGPTPSPLATGPNLDARRKPASAGFPSGYGVTCAQPCGHQPRPAKGVEPLLHAVSECGLENFVELCACRCLPLSLRFADVDHPPRE